MDFSSVPTVLTSISAAAEIAKLIKNSDMSLDKAETKLKLAELIEALADAKLASVDLQEKLSTAESRIKTLEKANDLKDSARWEEPFYWVRSESGEEGPFCQHCYDDAQKLVRLQGNGDGFYFCTVCKNDYTTSERRRQLAAEVESSISAHRYTPRF